MDIFRSISRNPLGLTVPALAILIVAFGIPTIFFFFASLNAPEYSLSNYQAFLSHGANVRILFQTIEISVIATLVCLAIGYPTAYLITAAPKRARVALTVLVFLPWLTSGLVRTYAWIVLLGDNGLINRTLIDLGLISSPLPLIYNRLAVYIGMVHIMLPVMILPLLSVMQGIDKSLVAAARSMGARPFTAFWRVFMPLSLPGVRSGAVLVFVICLGFYITPQALGGLRDVMLSTLSRLKSRLPPISGSLRPQLSYCLRSPRQYYPSSGWICQANRCARVNSATSIGLDECFALLLLQGE